MKIIITGGAGFIGSYVTRLLSLEHQVGILTRPSSSLQRIQDCVDHIDLFPVDMENISALNEQFAHFKPDIVLHLAWEGVLNRYRHDNVQTKNVSITMNILEAAINNGVKAWIGLGSQAEYGPVMHKITEDTIPHPTTLYGAAKLSTYLMAERRAAEAGLRFAWLRIFSTYGPTDNPEWMLPYLIRTLLKGDRPSLTAGEQCWDYLYVEDAARAIASVTTHAFAEGVFNVGSGIALPLREIIEIIRDTIDPHLPLGFGEVSYRPDQVMHLEACAAKLKKIVGWQPCVSLQEGIARTIAWYSQQRILA